MKKLWLLLFVCFNLVGHSFQGTHYTASFYGCSCLLYDSYVLQGFMNGISASGAKIIKHYSHSFKPYGMTAICLLEESHASIHTYPEHGAVFIDLFTCGEDCDWKSFERMLESYLMPKEIKRNVIER